MCPGMIPKELGKLSALEKLSLAFNNLSGADISKRLFRFIQDVSLPGLSEETVLENTWFVFVIVLPGSCYYGT